MARIRKKNILIIICSLLIACNKVKQLLFIFYNRTMSAANCNVLCSNVYLYTILWIQKQFLSSNSFRYHKVPKVVICIHLAGVMSINWASSS